MVILINTDSLGPTPFLFGPGDENDMNLFLKKGLGQAHPAQLITIVGRIILELSHRLGAILTQIDGNKAAAI